MKDKAPYGLLSVVRLRLAGYRYRGLKNQTLPKNGNKLD